MRGSDIMPPGTGRVIVAAIAINGFLFVGAVAVVAAEAKWVMS